MTANVLKFMSNTEIAIGTANTVSQGTLIRIVNPTTNVHVVTVKDANSVVLATFTMYQYSEVLLKKNATDTINADSGTDLKATWVAFAN